MTGIVTPGQYWINGDHIDDPTNSKPIFLDLRGDGNTYDLSGATINLDTRKLDGFGRRLSHDSGVDVIQINGSNNLVIGINLIGQDIALDTDPNAQRYADWATQYVELSGTNNTVDGANIVTRGSRDDTYGLSDAFGKGSSQGNQPYIGHRKASAFRVGEATNATVNDMHLELHTFGHGFFVQQSTNTTLTNSTVTGELFESQGVIDRPEYQEFGHTWWGHPIQDDILIAGPEDGVRTYSGSTGFTVDNVVVTNMRTGFAVSATAGDVSINEGYSFGNQDGFNIGSNTTITNSGGDIVNGPLLLFYTSGSGNNSIDLELFGGTPIGVNWSAFYTNGHDVDLTLTSDLLPGDLPEDSYVRLGQNFFQNWRDFDYRTSTPEDGSPIPLSDSTFINGTHQTLVLGENVEGNVGSSLGNVISNGKENYYDGVTIVESGSRLTLTHAKGLGNSGTETGAEFNSRGDVIFTGTATADTFDDNGTVVEDGATLEIAAEVRVTGERVTIAGDGVDGKGAIYTESNSGGQSRFVGDTIILDGDASVGVDGDGYILLTDRVTGTGDFTKRGDGALSIGRSSSLDGDFIVEQGILEGRSNVVRGDLFIHAGASVAAFGGNMVNAPDGHAEVDGTWNLNARGDDSVLSHQIGSISGSGAITSDDPSSNPGGTVQLRGDSGLSSYAGSITGLVNIEKSGSGTQIFGGSLNHTGTTDCERRHSAD